MDRSAPAVRRGNIYCAPWCGCGCLFVDYQKRCDDTAELAALLGSGWEARVWENCGWHGEVSCGAARVSVPGRNSRSLYGIGVWNIAGPHVYSRETDDKQRIASLVRECLAEAESALADEAEKLAPIKAWAAA